MNNIPSVDLSDFLSNNKELKKEFVKKVGKAYQEIGFLSLKGHFLSKENVDDLYTAWENVIKRAKQFEQHKIAKSELSVREHMTFILRALKENNLLEFSHFFNEEKDPIPKLVVCFLAILELSKERLIKINQQEPYSPLYIQLEEA